MKFIHACPDMRYWSGLEKRGFLNKDSGIKIHQLGTTPENRKFNIEAAPGTFLHDIVKESRCIFYIDRLIGGIPYYKYDFNKELINYYKELLGDNFYGFQLHEWASNFLQDVESLSRVSDNWTLDNIHCKMKESFIYKGEAPLHMYDLETFFAKGIPPKNRTEFFSALDVLYTDKSEDVLGNLITADSYFMTCDFTAQRGEKKIMPEVGGQINDMRIQIAYARGISKAYGIPFGLYYEPWSRLPDSICYNKDGDNEWHISTNGLDFPIHPNGGSSRAMQKRIFNYAFVCGAEFLSEEWGAANTFYNWIDHELSPYGTVKRDFINMTQRRTIGKPYIPFAVILPTDMKLLDLLYIDGSEKFAGFDFDSDSQRRLFSAVRSELKIIFGQKTNNIYGNESKGGTLCGGGLPELFDIIHAHNTAAFHKYDYLVDLTGSNLLHNNKKAVTLQQAASLCEKLAPAIISGDAHRIFNRDGDSWIVTIFNHDGVEHNRNTPEKLILKATRKVTVKTKNDNAQISCLEGSPPQLIDGVWHLELKPSDWTMLRIYG